MIRPLQPQPTSDPCPLLPPRVFVGRREARLLGMRTYLIDGVLVTAALVELPGVLCHCGGDEEGHPMVTSVALGPCGTDDAGREVFWDTGVVVSIGVGDPESGSNADIGPEQWDSEVVS